MCLKTWTAGASKAAAFAELVASPAEEAMPGRRKIKQENLMWVTVDFGMLIMLA